MNKKRYEEPSSISDAENHGQKTDGQRIMYPDRRAVDRILVSLASRCMNAPINQLDQVIDVCLKEIVVYFGGDRAFLWEFTEDTRQAALTHSSVVGGSDPLMNLLLQETLPYIFNCILGHQNLCVSHLEDLPPSAQIDRKYLDQSGIRSFLMIPLLVGGDRQGALSLASIRAERAWANKDLFQFQRFGTVIANALNRQRSHRQIEQRVRFETMIADLSANILKSPGDEIDKKIEQGLARVAEFFQVDRCGLLGIRPDTKFAWVSHAWYAEGIAGVAGDINLAALFPWVYDKLVAQRTPVRTTKVTELPPEADTDRQSYIAMGVQSSLEIPLLFEDHVSHIIVIQSLRDERLWPEELIPRLRLLGELFVSALVRQRAKRALKQSEERLDLAAASAEAALWEINVETGHLWTTQKGREMFGFPPDTPMTFEGFLEVIHPEDRDQVRQAAQKTLLSSVENSVEYRVKLSGGSVRWILSRGRPSPGRTTRLMGVSIDITERRLAEEKLNNSMSQMKATLESTADGILVVDNNGRITDYNDQFRRFWNIPPEILAAKDDETAMRFVLEQLKAPDQFVAKVKELYAHPDAVSLDVIEFKDGRVFERYSQPQKIDGTSVGRVWSFQDITRRKHDEEELRKSYAEIAALKERLEAENIYLQTEINASHPAGNIIGRSDPIKYVHYRIGQVAPLHTTVLIVGETGTGKGLVARAVHEGSPRKDRPMIHVNCAVLPANLIESELFGREKGAFTGAQAKQIGRFELADKGTIFLDEIAELPFELQAKLLRVVEDGEFERLGDPRTIKVDVRIIASTNRNLEEEISKGRFREDLFYRLNVFPITVPVLRPRTEDIPLIVDSLVTRLNKRMGRRITTVPQEVMQALKDYSWPGNVRELENVIERAIIMSRGPVLQLAEQLKDSAKNMTAVLETGPSGLADVEREHIRKTLEALKWKIEGPRGAAHALGMKPSTLRDRMQKLNILRPGSR
jgi:PAS domain S-box-containing protein